MKNIILIALIFGLFFGWLFVGQALAQTDLIPKDLINQKIFSIDKTNKNEKDARQNTNQSISQIPQIVPFLQNFWQDAINKISETFSLNIKKEINKGIQGPKYGFKKSFTILLKNINREIGKAREILKNLPQTIRRQLNPSPRY